MTEPIHDEQAERAVLGSALLSPDALQDAAAILGPDDFYVPTHARIWSAIAALWESGRPTDPTAVAAELDQRGELVKCGGGPYLSTLTSFDNLPTTANAGYHAGIVVEKSVLRRIMQAGSRITLLGESGSRGSSLSDVLEFVRLEVEDASNHRVMPASAVPVADAVGSFMDQLSEPLAGLVSTPWPELDDLLLGGMRRGELIVLAARSSTGKTLVALNMARQAARLGVPVQFLSGEMSRTELMARLMSDVATVPWAHLTQHALTFDDWDRLKLYSDVVAEWPLHIDDTLAGISLSEVRSRARHQARTGLGFLVIDQLNFIAAPDSRASEEQRYNELALRLKVMARELDVPILLLHQLNRGPANRIDKRPDGDADLRGADAIKHHADKVILFWRPPKTHDEIVAIVDKHRNGPTGEVTLKFEGRYARAVSDGPPGA